MNSRVSFFSAQTANQSIDPRASISRVLDRHWYVMGEEVKSFEAAFAAYCGVPYCVGLANGTDALELALRAVGVGQGDGVVLAANAGYYGSTAVRLIGATPIYVDVDTQSLTLCPRSLAVALEASAVKPRAIIATHLYGQLCDIESIAMLTRQHGVGLIEDCAQSHGASRNAKRAGSFGDIGCFSFYPTKNLGALGDGGAIVCSDARLAESVRSLRQYGWGQKYHNDLPHGRNSRLDEIQAALLNDKLPLLDAANAKRREVARYYHHAFSGLPLGLPMSVGEDFVSHLYVVRTPRRDALREFLNERGIACEVHYPVPDHLQRAYASDLGASSLPATEAACSSVLSLPCYPGISSADLERVTQAVTAFFVGSVHV